jgi:hypothetical protein
MMLFLVGKQRTNATPALNLLTKRPILDLKNDNISENKEKYGFYTCQCNHWLEASVKIRQNMIYPGNGQKGILATMPHGARKNCLLFV